MSANDMHEKERHDADERGQDNMAKEEFVKGSMAIFDRKEKMFRKKLAKEELAKCKEKMPNVEFIVDSWVDFNALLLKADDGHTAFWVFLDLDFCDRDKVEKYVGDFYDLIESVNKRTKK